MDELMLSFADFADLIAQIAASPDEVETELPPSSGGRGIYHSGHSALVAWMDALQDDPAAAPEYFSRFLQQHSQIPVQ